MGYAHFWSRVTELDRDAFTLAANDARVILDHATSMDLRLAGPSGKGRPDIGPETIAFNGAIGCGHRYRDLGWPFASPEASGVEEKDPPYDPKEEPWVGGGPYLLTRSCGGNCAGDPFFIDRKYLVRDWERPEAPDTWACSCTTHFKPYDLVATAVLVRLKERLGDAISIASENPEHGFEDAKRLCRELFGWSSKFEVKEPRSQVLI